MEITVIDERIESGAWWSMPRYAGYLAAAARAGEVYMQDVPSMVTNVLKKLGNQQIHRLNPIDHGSSYGVQIGSDRITAETIGVHAATLGKLRGRFAANGFVHLQHCMAANNQPLLLAFARVFGVRVYAGTGYHNPILRINSGNYMACDAPKGCKTTGRP